MRGVFTDAEGDLYRRGDSVLVGRKVFCIEGRLFLEGEGEEICTGSGVCTSGKGGLEGESVLLEKKEVCTGGRSVLVRKKAVCTGMEGEFILGERSSVLGEVFTGGTGGSLDQKGESVLVWGG